MTPFLYLAAACAALTIAALIGWAVTGNDALEDLGIGGIVGIVALLGLGAVVGGA